MRWRVALLPFGVVALVGTLASATPARVEQGDGLVVYSLEPATRSSAIDLAWRPNGEVVTLDDRPGLSEIDLSGRLRRLPLAASIQPEWHNGLVVAPDSAVLFSERGRVLRRGPDNTVGIIAGRTKPAAASGDGGPAVGAGMRPAGLALHGDGALLIADMGNHRVRRVDQAGRIATVAGTGRAGSSGDGSLATEARLTGPFAVSTFPDGSYVIAEGENRVRIRRVGVDGRIVTVAGGGRSTIRPCPVAPVPAASFPLGSFDAFGDVVASPSGEFLVASERGVFRVSSDGVLTAVSCGPPYPAPARGIYVRGRRAGDALLDASASPIAVGQDGSILVGTDLLAAAGAQRLAVALAPETLAAVHRRRIVVQSTGAARVTLRVVRSGRILRSLTADVGTGRTELRLARRLDAGIHLLRLTATDTRGRAATDQLRVLGRPFLSVRLARRFIRTGFDDTYEGEGEYLLRFARCRHQGPRVVQCKVTDGTLRRRPLREWWTASVTIRRDGVLVYRIRFVRSGKLRSSVIWFQ